MDEINKKNQLSNKAYFYADLMLTLTYISII